MLDKLAAAMTNARADIPRTYYDNENRELDRSIHMSAALSPSDKPPRQLHELELRRC